MTEPELWLMVKLADLAAGMLLAGLLLVAAGLYFLVAFVLVPALPRWKARARAAASRVSRVLWGR